MEIWYPFGNFSQKTDLVAGTTAIGIPERLDAFTVGTSELFILQSACASFESGSCDWLVIGIVDSGLDRFLIQEQAVPANRGVQVHTPIAVFEGRNIFAYLANPTAVTTFRLRVVGYLIRV